jgi:hypothetical protein
VKVGGTNLNLRSVAIWDQTQATRGWTQISRSQWPEHRDRDAANHGDRLGEAYRCDEHDPKRREQDAPELAPLSA